MNLEGKAGIRSGLRPQSHRWWLAAIIALLLITIAATAYALPYGNPENVTASEGTNVTVDISWDNMCEQYLDHYKIQYTYDAALSYWLNAGSVPANNCGGRGHFYHDPDYPYRTTYYRVLACPEPGYACAYPEPDPVTGYGMILPPQVSASDSSVGFVNITFSEDDHATYYKAYRSTTPDGTYTFLGDSALNTPSYTDSTATAGVLYYYKGKACNEYGCSDLSYFWDYGSHTTGAFWVQASDGTGITVQVTWETFGGVDYYRVYRTTTATTPGPGDMLGDAYSGLYTDAPPAAYVQYHYWVASCLGTDCSTYTSHDVGWRLYWPPLPPTVSEGTYTDKISLSWSATESFNNYKIYRSETYDGERMQVGTSTTTSFDDTSPTPGLTYFYRIIGCVDELCSGFSGADSGWMDWEEPSSVAATDGTSTANVEVSWLGVPGSTSYQVYRCTGTTTGTCGSAIASPTASPYQDTGATPGVTYYYRVKACAGASNCSEFSEYDSGWRALASPANVQASDGTYSDKVAVTWSSVTGATSYNVYRATASDGTKTLIGSPATASYNDTPPSISRTYYYWVEACGGGHCSALSDYDDGWQSLPGPDNFTASDGSSSSHVAMSWDSVTGANNYRVYRALTIDGTKTQIAVNLTETSYNDDTAGYGTQYYYWVAACAWAHCGFYSVEDTGWRAWPFQLYLPLIMR